MPERLPYVPIEALAEYVEQRVELRGWVYALRSSGKLVFLQLRDGTGVVQCVLFKPSAAPELWDRVRHLKQESCLRVEGTVVAHQKRQGEQELSVDDVEVLSEPATDYPISPKEHGTDFLMDHRHLWLRSRRQHAILKVRAELVAAIRDYFDSRGFTLVDAPIFTPNACEGTSTLFETDFHGEPAYLTQSGQLYAEAAAAAFGKTYCFGPTFRAEKSKTRRHLAEFWMVEPEVAFLDLEGDLDLAEDFLCNIVARVLDRRRRELELLERDLEPLARIAKPFPRIRYAEAIEILQRAGHDTHYGDDFGGDEETVISDNFDRPVMVTHYPRTLKPFYAKTDPEDSTLALNVDVLAPEGYGEVIGGAQREDDLDTLLANIDAHQIPRDQLEWYIDLRRYGSFPHSGFGLGLERTVSWICGLKHVRETSPFPRMLTRLRP
ncbi:MAG: asparagine--tRNA ligase [Myxococcales bacterium]|nr:asparagine--tRNA ligase [Myxococcales bacterium]